MALISLTRLTRLLDVVQDYTEQTRQAP